MSAGHAHTRPNIRRPAELEKLLKEGGAPKLMQRWGRLEDDQNPPLDDQHDVPDLAGYNVAGTTRYLDKDVFEALLDAEYATQILGEPIDTGLSPEDTIECLMEHEAIEKVLLDADNDVDGYKAAHDYATLAEHETVRKKGGNPTKYWRGLRKAIAYCEAKTPTKVPPDFACASLLDQPDDHDKRVIPVLRKLGVDDAFKASKASVDYGRSTGADRCQGCVNWQGSGTDLSKCSVVDGLVRNDRWCSKFDGTAAQTAGNIEESK